jgi:putative SOS response-associated peptidase YedK
VKSGRESIPYYISHKDERLFGFAGLWDAWKAPDGLFRKTFTVITTRPNSLVARYHDRMPAILLPENESRWLDSPICEFEEMQELLLPYPAGHLTAFRVSRAVNDPRREDPSIVRNEEDSVLPP